MVTAQAKRILIVDDDEGIVWLIKNKLAAEGYEVASFLAGPPAIDYVRRCGLPHLAVIDIGLPDMHGFELSQQLKELGDVPIVFISAKRETALVVDGLTLYAEDFITKPFKLRELIARIKRVLKRFPDYYYAQSPTIQVDDWL
ncbi:MAG: response regulator transcription factor, partial [Chloroflexi bacterium]|nr:response regulator transcription factor [Chloroflexota bacterium]